MPRLTLLVAIALVSLNAMRAADGEFKSIFDGRSLKGWETPEPVYWTVEDGAITGRITKDRPCNTNQYLVWKGGELADFELKMKCRLNGDGAINGGFQFRSRLLPDGDVCGYQMDNNLQSGWLVRLYDEYGRHDLAFRGERAVFDVNGERTSARMHEPADPAWFRLEEWHEYHLICRGRKISLSVDGRLACEIEDNDARRFEAKGILALQLHSGPATVVQFKDVELKILKAAVEAPKPAEVSAARVALQKEAVAWWALDAGGHGAKPSLQLHPAFYEFEMNVRAAGVGATRHGNVILMHGAHFEGAPEVLGGAKAFTVHLRARDPQGKWMGALMAKENGFALMASTNIVFSMGKEGAAHSLTAAISGDRTAWVDLTARYDGSSLALFQNGVRRGIMTLTPATGGELPAGSGFTIAGRRSGGKVVDPFRGELEVAGVWARALSDEEIGQLSAGAKDAERGR